MGKHFKLYFSIQVYGGLDENDFYKLVCLNIWSQLVALFG